MVDVPYEPADWEPIDWNEYASMKQDAEGFFVKRDEFGKSEMDNFVSNYGDLEDLPITFNSITKERVTSPQVPKVAPKRSVSVKTTRGTALRQAATRGRSAPTTASRTNGKHTNFTQVIVPREAKVERFLREDLRDEVLALEKEERRMCRHDDFSLTFDLEL